MKNYLQHADTVDAIAPVGGVVSGAPVLIGSLFGVPALSAAATETFSLRRKGAFTGMAKTAGTAWVPGDVLYWDDTAKEFTLTPGTNRRVAIALNAATAGATEGDVILVPTLGVTIADLGAVTIALATAGGNTYSDAAVNTAVNAALATIVAKINAALDGLR